MGAALVVSHQHHTSSSCECMRFDDSTQRMRPATQKKTKDMADDGYSASELRQRYGKGGSAKDSDLSAAQLRARYSIPNNGNDHLLYYGVIDRLID